MLKTLRLQRFRGFDNHELPFRELSIIVGKNNAGKSTIVEALRLVSIVSSRYRNLTYKTRPDWAALPLRHTGVTPALRGLEISFDSIFYRYEEPPARIVAEFADGSAIELYIHSQERVFALVRDSSGKELKSRGDAAKCAIPTVGIMPQVTPLQRDEVVLNQDYVRRSLASVLASSHFRNQLNTFYELFPEFVGSVEETWPGVQVLELVGRTQRPGGDLRLHIRNEDFVAEVGAMGHGLQMWLQTMWFLTRSKNATTIILDEPDVYMHADLQRRVIRFLRHRFPQVLIATHSVEIMAEVEPDEILVVDRRSSRSAYADSVPAVQRLAEDVGTAHNLHLSRMWSTRKFVLVEGKDLKLLKYFHNTLFRDSAVPLDTVPNMSIGGWGGWPYAVGSSMTLENAFGEAMTAYCVLDSDYHTDAQLLRRRSEAKDREVELHIWKRKEIENYLLCPEAIARVIVNRVPRRTEAPTASEISERIFELSERQRDSVFDAIAAEILAENRKLGQGGANKQARKILRSRVAEDGDLSGIVSGKAVLSELSKWSQEQFGVGFGPPTIARAMHIDEIPVEIKEVVSSIEEGVPFPTDYL